MSKLDIEETLLRLIEEMTQLKIVNKDENLFGFEYDIAARDMIYIILKLQEKIGETIVDIFQLEDFGLMTVNNLVDKIYAKLEMKEVLS